MARLGIPGRLIEEETRTAVAHMFIKTRSDGIFSEDEIREVIKQLFPELFPAMKVLPGTTTPVPVPA